MTHPKPIKKPDESPPTIPERKTEPEIIPDPSPRIPPQKQAPEIEPDPQKEETWLQKSPEVPEIP